MGEIWHLESTKAKIRKCLPEVWRVCGLASICKYLTITSSRGKSKHFESCQWKADLSGWQKDITGSVRLAERHRWICQDGEMAERHRRILSPLSAQLLKLLSSQTVQELHLFDWRIQLSQNTYCIMFDTQNTYCMMHDAQNAYCIMHVCHRIYIAWCMIHRIHIAWCMMHRIHIAWCLMHGRNIHAQNTYCILVPHERTK